MAQIYNSDVIKGLSNTAGIQTSRENPPNQLADKIVPTLETNPHLLRVARPIIVYNAAGTVAAGTITTTSAVNDTYITGIFYDNNQSATSDNIATYLRVTINGALTNIIYLVKPTLTLWNKTLYLQFPTPIKLDRNSSITFNCQFAAGACETNIIFYGYIVDTARA